jgi:archaetidylinositol phosphate synthase
MEPANDFRTAERSQGSILTPLEKRVLIWLAHRIPAWINSDHLTALGFLSLFGAGFSYWCARRSRAGLLLAIAFLILNWLGDSLDGTLARVRHVERPRYGFYVDHILDACGSLFVFAGLALSGYMSERVAISLLVAYLLLSIESYLATYTVGIFRLSFAAFGPTELRLLLIAGNIAILFGKTSAIIAGTGYRLFDVGGLIGMTGMSIALVCSIAKNITHLYRAETRRVAPRRQFSLVVRRWWRFNAVGIAGFVVQLVALWFLSKIAGVHYILATALAVEIAVLHNFAWHEVWTWRGLGAEGRWRRLRRFHAANGFVSIVSNVLFTAFLMQWIGLPLLAANGVAVVSMALLNFALAELWVFRRAVTEPERSIP